MNDKSDEPANPLAQSSVCALLCLAVVAQFAVTAYANGFTIGPLIQVSQDPDPLTGCDTGFRPPGNMNFTDQFETRVVVDPTNPSHLVATWVGHDLAVSPGAVPACRPSRRRAGLQSRYSVPRKKTSGLSSRSRILAPRRSRMRAGLDRQSTPLPWLSWRRPDLRQRRRPTTVASSAA